MQITWSKWLLVAICVATPCAAPQSRAQDKEAPAPTAEAPVAESPAAEVESAANSDSGLTTGQRQVAERFRELEKLLLRMAELTAPTDPRRAALLRQAVAQSKQRDIDHQFEELVELLRQERLAVVVKGQGQVQQDLAKLLELLLSEDRTKRIESEKERVREYLKRVNKIIKEQKALQGETGRGADERKLAGEQGELADKTGELAGDVEANSGKQPAGQSADGEPKPQGDEKAPKDDSDKSPDSKDGEPTDKPGDPQEGSKKGDSKKDGDPTDKDKSDKENDADKSDKETKDPSKGNAEDVPPPEPAEGKDAKGSKPGGDKSGKPQKPGQPQPGQPQDGEGQQGESQDGEQQPPPEQSPAQKRLQQAQQRMKEAQKKLEEAQRKDAADKQAEAIQELEAAKAELEEILRQLREEEMARTLAMLETRFRKMLEAQIEVYEGTSRLDKVPQAERDRDDEIEAGRLSRKEAQISTEADKALTLLREEGSAVAFPEAVVEIRDDMDQVVIRLAEAKVGDVTQGIETDIIAALEEMIAALQKAQKDMEKKKQQGQPSPAGEGQEPPLVDTLSELKMIRAMQMRINLRTERYAKLTKDEQAEAPDLLDALKRLAEREQRIHQVTRDIVVGRNR